MYTHLARTSSNHKDFPMNILAHFLITATSWQFLHMLTSCPKIDPKKKRESCLPFACVCEGLADPRLLLADACGQFLHSDNEILLKTKAFHIENSCFTKEVR